MMEIRPILELGNSIDELNRMLAVAESESRNPLTKKKTHQEVMERLRERIDDFKSLI